MISLAIGEGRLGRTLFALAAWGAMGACGQAALPPALEIDLGTEHPSEGVVRSWSPMLASATGASRQVNVDALGRNIVGDAANEPSLCLDPANTRRMAIGWRQFDTVTDSFRQAGWAYSSDGGASWTFPGVLESNVFRSDPVLAADAAGQFYYLSLQPSPLRCDLWSSSDGGKAWQRVGPALGGDKAWLTIDTTTGPGRGHIYQAWSPAQNVYTNRIFSRSTDGGRTWSDPIPIPASPYWGTLDIGPSGELYVAGWNGSAFWINRSTNAPQRDAALVFDLTRQVHLGGAMIYGAVVNPVGLAGQPWVAVDRSSGPTRGNVYLLCTVTGTGNPANVMFARSTNGGMTWSSPVRINDDSPTQGAWHWFGTMAVAPNGRIDVVWNDTRSASDHAWSELYYSCSRDGGLTWTANRAVSPPFNHTLGYPMQAKMGDYIGMVSLSGGACIAYAATFHGEEDIYFLRLDHPSAVRIAHLGGAVRLWWDADPGTTYSVQFKGNMNAPWSSTNVLGWVTADGPTASIQDSTTAGRSSRFYRVVRGTGNDSERTAVAEAVKRQSDP